MPPGASNSEQGGTNMPPGSPRPHRREWNSRCTAATSTVIRFNPQGSACLVFSFTKTNSRTTTQWTYCFAWTRSSVLATDSSGSPGLGGRSPMLPPLNGVNRSPGLGGRSPMLPPPQRSTPDPAGLRPPGSPRPERLTSPSSFSSEVALFHPLPTAALEQVDSSWTPESLQPARPSSRRDSYELPPLIRPHTSTHATANDNVPIASAWGNAAQDIPASNPQGASQDAMDWRSDFDVTVDDINRSGTGNIQQQTQTQQHQDGSHISSRSPPPRPVSRSPSPPTSNQTGSRSRENSAQNSGAPQGGPSIQPAQAQPQTVTGLLEDHFDLNFGPKSPGYD
ncbi:hypothetical protein CcaCcLH18_01185 [Colletotrichum camelliae]|nr:hypothetical protein CcaCcLH18_01185 [Colletotrichum camelliae]